jgi:hypothetical protein
MPDASSAEVGIDATNDTDSIWSFRVADRYQISFAPADTPGLDASGISHSRRVIRILPDE